MTSEQHDAAADWHAVAHQALLDHLNRGDPRHALRLLLAALSRRLRRPCRLHAEQADGTLRWQIDASPGLDVDAQADAGAPLLIGLSLLGRHVGSLHLLGLGPDHSDLAARLEPVRASAAALLLNEAAEASTDPRPGYVEMIRSALRGGGTFV